MVITILPRVTPVFDPVGPYCAGSSIPALPTVSRNGISGTWSPVISNHTTATYTFTPDEGQCAVAADLSVTIIPTVLPTFQPVGPFCQDSAPTHLPTISNEGVRGTWSPEIIRTDSVGVFIYTFTPDSGQCALVTSYPVTIHPLVRTTCPSFEPVCQNSEVIMFSLPGTVTYKGVNITQFNPVIPGTYTFIYTSNSAVDCVESCSFTITVTATPQVFAGADREIESGSWVTITDATASSSYPIISYSWTPASVFLDPTAQSPTTREMNETTTVRLTVTDINGCTRASELTIAVKKLPLVVRVLPSSDEICPGDSIQLLSSIKGGSGKYSYNWTSVPAGFKSDDPSPIVSPSQTTTYILTVSDGETSMSGMMKITVNDPPKIMAVYTTNVKGSTGGSAYILASGNYKPFKYRIDSIGEWKSSPEFITPEPGKFTAWVMDAKGCVSSSRFDIYFEQNVDIIAKNGEGCMNSEISIPIKTTGVQYVVGFTLQIEFDESITMFNKLTGLNSQINDNSLQVVRIRPGLMQIIFNSNNKAVDFGVDETLFVITFTALNKGVSTLVWNNSFFIYAKKLKGQQPAVVVPGTITVFSSPDALISGGGNYCEGTSLTLRASKEEAGVTYTWKDGSGNSWKGSSWPLGKLTPAHSGAYQLTAVNQFGCENITIVPVKVNPLPIVKLADSDTICILEPTKITPGLGYLAYTWQDRSTRPTFTVEKEGRYWVEVIDENGCVGKASLVVIPCEYKPKPDVNAFWPEGSGRNTTFNPLAENTVISDYRMEIFNRWGEKVFETNSLAHGWDGQLKSGKLAPAGVYAWVITYKLPVFSATHPQSVIHGTVVLIR